VKNRQVYYLLASRSGFTEELEGSKEVLLVEGV
jgi:hypothetical protein